MSYTLVLRSSPHADALVFTSESDLNFSPTSPASQQSVILYSAPSKVPASTINQLVSTDGIASLYITNLGEPNPYASIPSNFASFVSTVAADS